jgi:hypothetical protein
MINLLDRTESHVAFHPTFSTYVDLPFYTGPSSLLSVSPSPDFLSALEQRKIS